MQDSAQKLAQAAIDACIVKAVKGRYAQARPLLRIKDFAGDSATYEYAVDAATFADWVDEASFIRSLEYPAGEKEPVYIDPDDYRIVQISSTVKMLRLLTTVPQAGKTLRIEYSVPHSDDASTVPGVDFEAVSDLAASYACVALAAYYNQMGDPAYGAAAVDHQSKSQQYLSMAKKYGEQFEGALGLNADVKQRPATSWREWEAEGGGGELPLTH